MKLAVVTTLSCVASFFVCAIPCGLLVAKWLGGGVDVRSVGSGNIGSTNVVRAAGAKAGLLTLALDAGKGALAIILSRWALMGIAGVTDLALSEKHGMCLAMVYAACIAGHCFSPYLKFKGGKGIAVGFGAALALMPWTALGLLVVFLVVTIPTRYVSLGSLCAAISLPFLVSFIYHGTLSVIICMVAVSLIVAMRHGSNIKKLLDGKESKFSFHRNK